MPVLIQYFFYYCIIILRSKLIPAKVFRHLEINDVLHTHVSKDLTYFSTVWSFNYDKIQILLILDDFVLLLFLF